MRNVRMLKDILADCISDLCNGETELAGLVDPSNKSKSKRGKSFPKRQYRQGRLKKEVQYK